MVEGGDDFLAEDAVETVFGGRGEGYDEDIAVSAEGELGEGGGGWRGRGHVGLKGDEYLEGRRDSS